MEPRRRLCAAATASRNSDESLLVDLCFSLVREGRRVPQRCSMGAPRVHLERRELSRARKVRRWCVWCFPVPWSLSPLSFSSSKKQEIRGEKNTGFNLNPALIFIGPIGFNAQPIVREFCFRRGERVGEKQREGVFFLKCRRRWLCWRRRYHLTKEKSKEDAPERRNSGQRRSRRKRLIKMFDDGRASKARGKEDKMKERSTATMEKDEGVLLSSILASAGGFIGHWDRKSHSLNSQLQTHKQNQKHIVTPGSEHPTRGDLHRALWVLGVGRGQPRGSQARLHRKTRGCQKRPGHRLRADRGGPDVAKQRRPACQHGRGLASRVWEFVDERDRDRESEREKKKREEEDFFFLPSWSEKNDADLCLSLVLFSLSFRLSFSLSLTLSN